MQSVEKGQNPSSRRPGQSEDGSAGSAFTGWASRGSGVTFAVMVVILLVALLFAANQNDVIGWLLVVISAGWLILAILVVLGVRRGAKSVDRRMKNFSASLAPRVGGTDATGPSASGTGPTSGGSPSTGDSLRDTKLDHSFKIVQVQARVVTEELDKGADADTDMVARALETIEVTSSNARDMLKEPGAGQNPDGPISGEVIN
ncbi:hypothetical protein [Citricoccus sp. GCM10030269]|uniref:hypothetical protein n=1 Tax=Citricoccus sp. GCM10030269 TaxID=3273388 RepID=UPI003610BD22